MNVAVAGALTLTDGALGSDTIDITADSVSVDAASNADGAKGIHATGTATVTATTSIENYGLIAGDGGLTITTPELTNTGTGVLSTTGSLTLKQPTAGGIISNAGVVSGGSLSIDFDTLNNSASIGADVDIYLQVLDLNNIASGGGQMRTL